MYIESQLSFYIAFNFVFSYDAPTMLRLSKKIVITMYMSSTGIAFPRQKNDGEVYDREVYDREVYDREVYDGEVYDREVYDCNSKKYATPSQCKSVLSNGIPIRCPSKPKIAPDTRTSRSVSDEKFRIASTIGLHDPTTINTPPTDFMKQLKNRMSVYFTHQNETL